MSKLHSFLFATTLICAGAQSAAAGVIDTRDLPNNFDQTDFGRTNTMFYAQSVVADDTLLNHIRVRVTSYSAATPVILNVHVTGSRACSGGLGLCPNFADTRYTSSAQTITSTATFTEIALFPFVSVALNETVFIVLDAYSQPNSGAGTVRATEYGGTEQYSPGEFVFLNASGSGQALTTFDSQTWAHRSGNNEDLAFYALFVPDLCQSNADCDDNNPCTDNYCDPKSRISDLEGCVYLDNDQNVPPQNATDDCYQEVCISGEIVSVIDDTETPDDGVYCTNDVCSNGVPSNTPDDTNCDDENDCTIDTCDALLDCQATPEPVDTPCGNTQAAGLCDAPDSCDRNGVCLTNITAAGVVCDTANGLCDVDDLCDGVHPYCPWEVLPPGTPCGVVSICAPIPAFCDGKSDYCPYSQTAAPGTACPNGDVCDGTEICDEGGNCLPAEVPLDCDDGDACTADTCDPVTGCGSAPIPDCCVQDADCLAPDACTAASCDLNAGLCTYTRVLAPGCCLNDGECDDDDVCTVDVCSGGAGGACVSNPISGCCVDDVECDDGNDCIANSCDLTSNMCDSAPVPGCCTTNTDCSDGNACTTDTCDVASGNCSNVVTDPNCCSLDGDCADGNVCTTDTCDGATNTCAHAAVSGCCNADADCDDGDICTTDSCNVNTNLCEAVAVAGCCTVDADCDDGDACTSNTCDVASGACQSAPVQGCCALDSDCDDMDQCTINTCVDSACVDTPVAGCGADAGVPDAAPADAAPPADAGVVPDAGFEPDAGSVVDAGVEPTNDPPEIIELAPIQVREGTRITFTVRVTDPNGDLITLMAEGLPPGATFDSPTGVFDWPSAMAGMYVITITATDNGTPPMTDTITVQVTIERAGDTDDESCTCATVDQSADFGGSLLMWAVLFGLTGLVRRRRI